MASSRSSSRSRPDVASRTPRSLRSSQASRWGFLFDLLASVAAAGLVVAVGGLAEGCGSKPAGKSLVVITLDTTRADHLGAYGYPLPTTPNLDALAQQGVVFEQAYAPMPQTLPSHATLFTGLPPRGHKALENAHVLDAQITTLAELLAERDYETAAFIGARVLDDSTGIEQGFKVFDLPTGKQRDIQHEVERRGDAVTDSALSWALARHFAAKPFLLWAHYYDPHGPYEARSQRIAPEAVDPIVRALPEFQGQAEEALAATSSLWYAYDNELAYMDAQVGRLLKGLRQRKMLDDAIVVVVGDHGEGLMEHGEKGHGANVFQELMLVPLIIVMPDGSYAGRRIHAQVQMQDLLPTLLDLAGLAGAAGELPGLDLAPMLRSGSEPDARPVFLQRPYYSPDGIRAGRAEAQGGFGELASVIVGQDKLIRQPPDATTGEVRHHLYDLAADPDELHDVAAEHPELVAKLSALIDEWLARYPADLNAAPPITAERQAELAALGYVGLPGDAPPAPPAPKATKPTTATKAPKPDEPVNAALVAEAAKADKATLEQVIADCKRVIAEREAELKALKAKKLSLRGGAQASQEVQAEVVKLDEQLASLKAELAGLSEKLAVYAAELAKRPA